jgi:hypothetical protein
MYQSSSLLTDTLNLRFDINTISEISFELPINIFGDKKISAEIYSEEENIGAFFYDPIKKLLAVTINHENINLYIQRVPELKKLTINLAGSLIFHGMITLPNTIDFSVKNWRILKKSVVTSQNSLVFDPLTESSQKFPETKKITVLQELIAENNSTLVIASLLLNVDKLTIHSKAKFKHCHLTVRNQINTDTNSELTLNSTYLKVQHANLRGVFNCEIVKMDFDDLVIFRQASLIRTMANITHNITVLPDTYFTMRGKSILSAETATLHSAPDIERESSLITHKKHHIAMSTSVQKVVDRYSAEKQLPQAPRYRFMFDKYREDRFLLDITKASSIDHDAYASQSYFFFVCKLIYGIRKVHYFWQISYVMCPVKFIKLVIQTSLAGIESMFTKTPYIEDLLAFLFDPGNTILRVAARRAISYILDEKIIRYILVNLPPNPQQATWKQIEMYGMIRVAQLVVIQLGIDTTQKVLVEVGQTVNQLLLALPGATLARAVVNRAEEAYSSVIDGGLKQLFPKWDHELPLMQSINPQHPSFQYLSAVQNKRQKLNFVNFLIGGEQAELKRLSEQIAIHAKAYSENNEMLNFLKEYKKTKLSRSVRYEAPKSPIPEKLKSYFPDGVKEDSIRVEALKKMIVDFESQTKAENLTLEELRSKQVASEANYQKLRQQQSTLDNEYTLTKRDFYSHSNELQQTAFKKWEEDRAAREIEILQFLATEEARSHHGNIQVTIPVEIIQQAFDKASSGLIGKPIDAKETAYTILSVKFSTNQVGSLEVTCEIRIDRFPKGEVLRVSGFTAKVNFSVNVEDSIVHVNDLSGESKQKVKLTFLGVKLDSKTGVADQELQKHLNSQRPDIEKQISAALENAFDDISKQNLGENGQLTCLSLAADGRNVKFGLQASGNFQYRLEYPDFAKAIFSDLYQTDLNVSYSHHYNAENKTIMLRADYADSTFLQLSAPINFSTGVMSLAHPILTSNIPDFQLQFTAGIADFFVISQYIGSDFIKGKIDALDASSYVGEGHVSLDSSTVDVNNIDFRSDHINVEGLISANTSSYRFRR